ncbi:MULTISPECIES: DUF3592 domain-containing protein [unclassified Streptomyces]|uniref:DUF3592 domain-containing protein n=1 Tax=unclassified Streptomyces TaxID=2593676 RepID=UPI001661E177|nr:MULTISPECIES: DUF3592 domain-containing protein [unclassified Streptomyces]MBD0841838.1 DUF3592 domain-containing protein [Streptomyces sp. TRM68416]
MEVFFYIVPSLMIAFALLGAASMIRRSRRVSRAWSSGLTAEARCLRMYTTASGGGDTMVRTTLHHVYEFTTREGRTVRFEEQNGPATTVEGDIVTVHYLADRPEQATAHAPARGRLAAESGCVLAFLGVFIAFCVGFMVVVHLGFELGEEFMP